MALLLVAVLAVPLAGCGSAATAPPSIAPTPSALPSSEASPNPASADPREVRNAGWVADIDAIVPALEDLHPDPWHGTSRSAVASAVDALRSEVPTASDDALMVGVLRIVAMISAEGRDGHTGAFVWGSGTYPTHTLPLRLWVFPEGVAVVDALPPYTELVGRVITSIDGTPTADVVAALRPVMPHDNDSTLLLLAPRFLLTTEILHGAGLIDDPAAVSLAFTDDPSSPVDVVAIPTAAYNQWATPYGLHLPTRADVPYLARSEEPLWTRVDDGTTLYIQYNRVTRLVGSELEPIRTSLADPAIRRVIVDIRHNFGGESSGYLALAAMLVEFEGARRDGMFVITGRNAFSAATLFAVDLSARIEVTFVGESMGGSPSFYANTRDVALAQSGLVLSVATEHYELVPGDQRLEIPPDVPVSLGLADFLAGRDPVLSAAEAAVRQAR